MTPTDVAWLPTTDVAETYVCTGSAVSDPPERARPGLLIEVPHGADTQALYDQLEAQLTSPLPPRLEKFFWVNTDVAAFALALRIAERFVQRHPEKSALVVRCTIPRTFVDVNRVLDDDAERPKGLTPGMQPWIRTPEDQQRLYAMHREYTAFAGRAYRAVLGPPGTEPRDDGPVALIPHTYAPRSVPITVVDMDIVGALEAVYAPGEIEKAPLRAEIDFITETPEGEDQSPPGLVDALVPKLAALGHQVAHNHAYSLHPVTMGAKWSGIWPGRVLCFEVRRDLVTHWDPFVVKALREDAIDGIAGAVASSL
jgi:hypothetical protein